MFWAKRRIAPMQCSSISLTPGRRPPLAPCSRRVTTPLDVLGHSIRATTTRRLRCARLPRGQPRISWLGFRTPRAPAVGPRRLALADTGRRHPWGTGRGDGGRVGGAAGAAGQKPVKASGTSRWTTVACSGQRRSRTASFLTTRRHACVSPPPRGGARSFAPTCRKRSGACPARSGAEHHSPVRARFSSASQTLLAASPVLSCDPERAA
jgi:hypothetical protein